MGEIDIDATTSVRPAVRVVIVDDTPDLRMLVRTALERDGGFEVVAEAANGREGVDASKEQLPDVVLLDIAMPEMDGLQAAPEIRAACPEAIIVMLSGFTADKMRDAALRAGADYYLEKTASVKAVVSGVRRCLELHSV